MKPTPDSTRPRRTLKTTNQNTTPQLPKKLRSRMTRRVHGPQLVTTPQTHHITKVQNKKAMAKTVDQVQMEKTHHQTAKTTKDLMLMELTMLTVKQMLRSQMVVNELLKAVKHEYQPPL